MMRELLKLLFGSYFFGKPSAQVNLLKLFPVSLTCKTQQRNTSYIVAILKSSEILNLS